MAAIGVLGLAENLFGVNLGLYRLWAGDHLGPGPPLNPGAVPPMPSFRLVLRGSALLLMSWTRAGAPRWLPLQAGLVLVIVSLCAWWALRAEQVANLEERTRGEAVRIHGEMGARMESRVLTLVRVARNWERWGPPHRQEGENDAQIVAELHPVYHAIEWVDASFHVRWVAPAEGNEAEQNRNLALDPTLAEALGAAGRRREVTVSRSLDLAGAGKGFAV
ncbi:MAG: hypothetical protein AAB225_06020 [Acidobacteriota bacterium]